MPKLPKLPIGIQTFEKLREKGYLYVDKTKYLVDLIDSGNFYFLSRPRRFGKSLTISTFDALFSGKRELFEGLAAEEFFERPDYRPYPVIRLDMSEASASEGREPLFSHMTAILERNAKRHGVEFRGASPQEALTRLIWDVSAAKGPAVVLIDEYDSPLLDVFDDHDESKAIREIMRGFYKRIKAADERLRFVFITGISKFPRMGIFSAMNNLIDVSVDKKYGAMLGYTEEELISYFFAHVDATAGEMNIERGELLSRIEDYYDGFSFDGIARLYNPYSTLYFFERRDFLNYWFESGTPSFIAKYMKDKNLTVEQFRGMGVSKDFAVSPGEIENSSAEGFLYQSGYLTLRPGTFD
ncbi:MAG: AAA family ATPase, partial [Synergistaceae bacterium]|nr:AAA family ATPase [Synergistaceae bacterium]